jgi:membrane protease YdiL (CAAX protease family)
MAELPLGPAAHLWVGPVSGAAVFLLLAGGRIPRARPRLPGRSLAVRWASLGAAAGLEEVVWRGIVLGRLVAATGTVAGLALSSAAFAVWHWRSLGPRCGVHLVTGAGFGSTFLVGGLAAAILAHGVYNVLVDWAVHAERARLRGP